jgi:nitroimidazol reductase NimA-like FMN-containing flavoprotein (pyridoxamine 5'-phosphate oxidase superfamily)
MSYSMTVEERQAFLAGVHVGVMCVEAEGRGPAAVPVWYDYEPGGEVRLCSGKSAKKVSLLERAGRFSLCAQDEDRPYRYVSVEGPVVAIEPCDRERDLRPIARRYLGVEGGDRYVEETLGTSSVLIRMRPERWSSRDYGKEDG